MEKGAKDKQRERREEGKKSMKEEGRKGRRKKEAHMYLNTRQRAERGKERGRTKTEGGREGEEIE